MRTCGLVAVTGKAATLITLGLWTAVTACSPPRYRGSASLMTVQQTKSHTVRASTLGPGDVFEVRVYGEPDLTGLYRVSPAGEIQFPLIGSVRVDGRLPQDVERVIADRLKNGFLREPQISLFVKEYNSQKIFVFGEVNKAGTFPFEANMSIIQAITLAGGFTKAAWKNRTHVTRIVNGKKERLEVPVEAIGEGREKNFPLQPGDIVFVPESPI